MGITAPDGLFDYSDLTFPMPRLLGKSGFRGFDGILMGVRKYPKKEPESPLPLGEWLRLPKDGELCPETQLSRSVLGNLCKVKDPISGELLIQSVLLKDSPEATRGSRRINRRSLLNYMEWQAKDACEVQWSAITRPGKYSGDEVLNNRFRFAACLDPEAEIDEETWEHGELSKRAARIELLGTIGWLISPDQTTNERWAATRDHLRKNDPEPQG